MSAKVINRLVHAVVLLAVVYGLVLFGQSRQTTPGVAVPANLTGLSKAADKLVVKTATNTIELEREGSKWFKGKKAIKQSKSAGLLEALEKLDFARVVSTKSAEVDKYGLSEQAARYIRIYQDKKLLKTIYIGENLGPDRFYVRIGGKSAVYEGTGGLSSELDEPISQWIDNKKKAEHK